MLRFDLLNVVSVSTKPILISVTYHNSLNEREEKRTLSFSVNRYGRISFKNIDVFEQLNNFLLLLPNQIHLEMFNIYDKIYKAFCDRNLDLNAIQETLTTHSLELLSLIDYNRLVEWTTYTNTITIPAHLTENYINNVDVQWTREQTYTKNDYLLLISLSIKMRCMLPVWGEYLTYITNGNYVINDLKEYWAFKLIEGSDIFELEAFKKLQQYIEFTISNKGTSSLDMEKVINGINNEMIYDWVLSLIIVKRFCIGDLSGRDPKANIIPFIYKYIMDRLKEDSTKTADSFAVKDPIADDDGGDDHVTALDETRVRHNLSIGDVEIIKASIENPQLIIDRFFPFIPKDLLEQCIQETSLLYRGHMVIRNIHLHLLGAIMNVAVSPRAWLYVDKVDIIPYIAIAQALLWHKGHYFLSLLVSSYQDLEILETDGLSFLSLGDTKQQLPKEKLALLKEHYPYGPMCGGKKVDTKGVFIYDDIESLIEQMERHRWITTSSTSKIEFYYGPNKIRMNMLEIPINIREILADFLISNADGSFLS